MDKENSVLQKLATEVITDAEFNSLEDILCAFLKNNVSNLNSHDIAGLIAAIQTLREKRRKIEALDIEGLFAAYNLILRPLFTILD